METQRFHLGLMIEEKTRKNRPSTAAAVTDGLFLRLLDTYRMKRSENSEWIMLFLPAGDLSLTEGRQRAEAKAGGADLRKNRCNPWHISTLELQSER